jgi:hypothetical protein
MRKKMAIVKASYTRKREIAKASIRYMQHRPGKDGAKLTRTLFNSDGLLTRKQAYGVIDAAATGSTFFRFVISPDPAKEDTGNDLFLREITELTMLQLEDRLQKRVQWIATEHSDHAPHRHVHVLAVVTGRLTTQDLQSLRETATHAALLQRKERDLAQEQKEREREEGLQRAW